MENNGIVIATKPDVRNYIRLNRFIMTRTKRAVAFWLAPIIFLLLGLMLYIIVEPLLGIIFIGVSPLMLVLMLILNMVMTKMVMKSSKFYSESGIIVFYINDSGIEQRTSSMKFYLKWEEIYRVYETNKSFYIMQDNMQAFIIDKECLTEEQAKSVEEVLKNKLNKKKFVVKKNRKCTVKYLTNEAASQMESEICKSDPSCDETRYNITVTTTLTLEACIRFNYFHLFKGGNKLILILLPVLFIANSITHYLNNDIRGVVVFLVLAISIVPITMFVTSILVKKNFKSNKFLENITDVFFGFNDEGYTQIVKGSKTSFKWDQIFKSYETKKCFYIYVSRLQSHIIMKKDFTDGGADKLRELMKSKLTKKQYKIKNRV